MTAEAGELPEGWATAALGEIADCRLGKMLDQAKNQGERRPYLRNTNVQWGEIGLDDIKEMRIKNDERERYGVRPGDLVVCEGGEPGRCAVWRDDREMYLQKALHRVRAYEGVSADYLRWWLQEAAGSGQLEDLFTGSTIKHLPGRQLARVRVPLAPSAEQHRIAQQLDDVEACRWTISAHLRAARSILERVRAAVFAAACSGRLTAEWRDAHADTNADQLHADLIRARGGSIRHGSRAPQARGLTSETQLELLPSSWSLVRLGDILDVATGATPLRKNRAYYAGGTVPWVTSGAVNAGTITSPTEMITPLALSETNVKLFPVGTLLVAMYGEGQTRGRVAELAIEAGTNQAVAAVVFADATAPLRPFMRLFFEDSYQRVRALSVGGVQPNLNLGMIKDTMLPLPPLAEQVEIVERSAVVLAAADRSASQIEHAAAALDRASRACLAKAFRGELVPTEARLAEAEGRCYEYAAEILVRLAEAQPSKPPRRRRAPVSA